jgi:hypothetical protein
LQLGHFFPFSFLCIFVFFLFHMCALFCFWECFIFLNLKTQYNSQLGLKSPPKYWLGYGKFLESKQNMSRSWSKNATKVKFNLINVDNSIMKKKWFTMIKYIGQTPMSSFIHKDDKQVTNITQVMKHIKPPCLHYKILIRFVGTGLAIWKTILPKDDKIDRWKTTNQSYWVSKLDKTNKTIGKLPNGGSYNRILNYYKRELKC